MNLKIIQEAIKNNITFESARDNLIQEQEQKDKEKEFQKEINKLIPFI